MGESPNEVAADNVAMAVRVTKPERAHHTPSVPFGSTRDSAGEWKIPIEEFSGSI
jgi:hypothetical protein